MDMDNLLSRIALSPNEAAQALGVARQTIYRRINDGHLRPYKFGRRTLIPVGQLGPPAPDWTSTFAIHDPVQHFTVMQAIQLNCNLTTIPVGQEAILSGFLGGNNHV